MSFRAEAMLAVLSERGYLVIVSPRPLPLGHRFAGIAETSIEEQPFAVIAETDYADCLAQRDLYRVRSGIRLEDCSAPGCYFYRVTTD